MRCVKTGFSILRWCMVVQKAVIMWLTRLGAMLKWGGTTGRTRGLRDDSLSVVTLWFIFKLGL